MLTSSVKRILRKFGFELRRYRPASSETVQLNYCSTETVPFPKTESCRVRRDSRNASSGRSRSLPWFHFTKDSSCMINWLDSCKPLTLNSGRCTRCLPSRKLGACFRSMQHSSANRWAPFEYNEICHCARTTSAFSQRITKICTA